MKSGPQSSQSPVSLRRLSYQAQRDINYFVNGLDESFRSPVRIAANLNAGADLEKVASESDIAADTLLAAREEIKRLIEQTGSADDLVKREIERLLGPGPAAESPAAQPEAAPVAEQDKVMSPDDHVRQLINKFSEVEQAALLPDYLASDRNDRLRVSKMTQEYGLRFLAAENEFSEMAEQLGCTVESLRNAVGIVRKGGTVVADHLTPKNVVIQPEVNPPTAEAVVISPGQKEPVSERIRRGFRQIFGR
jgi:hypothetical protein